MSVWPPVPPDPPHPLRTPWHPEPAAPRPAAPPSSSGRSLIADTEPDWLTERLVGRRLVALAGELDRDAALIDSLADRAARPPPGDGAGRSAGDSAATTDIPPTRLDP